MPYAITGYLNLHPRSAIEQMASSNRAEVVELYQIGFSIGIEEIQLISGLTEPVLFELQIQTSIWGIHEKQIKMAIGLWHRIAHCFLGHTAGIGVQSRSS